MRWKDFLYFQRNSKIGVILLLILIFLVLLLNTFLSFRKSSEVVIMQNDSLVREFDEFRQSLTVRRPTTTTTTTTTTREGENGTSRSSGRTGTVQGTTSQGVLSGVSSSQPANSQESIHDENAITDNTQLKHGSPDVNVPRNRESTQPRTNYPSYEKLAVGESISLNNSDTTAWKKVPGIGSAYASRIVKYRTLLGGFVHKEQLLEIYGMDHELYARIAPYVEADGSYHKMMINSMEFNDLLRHPYLNYKQVQAIMSLRRRKGDIASIRELSMLNEFTTEDIIRLEPYLGF